MRTEEEIKKEIEEVSNQIAKEYRDCKYEYGTKEQSDWFNNIVWPLDQKKSALEKELYRVELFNVKVGDGVTTWSWTDRYAYTVIKRTNKTITIQRDIAKRIDKNGMSDCQEYSYERNPEGEIETFRWSDKKNRWVHSCYRLCLGRDEYFDYSF